MLFLALVAGALLFRLAAAQAATLAVNIDADAGGRDIGTFEVQAPPPGRFTSLSTKASVENGDGSLVNEFGIEGAPKQIVLRALGPSLANAGIASPLADPTLELRNGDGGLIASNDNWRSDQETAIQATGLAPPDDLEAAIVATVSPGFYAAVVRGKNGGTGTAIGEVYDLDASNASSSLTALGARGLVGILVAEVSCSFADMKFLVRALGPSLSSAGISGAVQDPTLALRRNFGLIASNDDWRSDQAAEIIDSGLAPTDERESAIVVTVPPDRYEGVPAAVNNTGGIGFVQFYDLPFSGVYSGNPLPLIPIPPSATPTPPTPTPPPTTQAVNLSTRMKVQTGANVGIGGFIITGTAPKHVLIRAIGPSLAQFVPGALADPELELHGPGAFVTITNYNWRDTQHAAIEATGIPPTDDLESAIDATLAPGAYTAIVRGDGIPNTGVALVEVYDLNQGVDSKLANLSTRAFVETNDGIVIGGFILVLGSQSGDDRIVVRGIGPSLTTAGVPNALADPTLELRDSNGALLIANNDWQDDPAQAAELTTAGLAPTSPLESGIAATLPPGPYTALLAGLNNGVGVGLVEVYDRGAP